jgi:hypothetical protein
MTQLAEEFKAKALAHYQAKLAEERERFGVKAISDDLVEHNSRVVVEHMADTWADIGQQLGGHMVVNYTADPQTVYVLISDSPVPRPDSFYELWLIVQRLSPNSNSANVPADEELSETIEDLDFYEGPYKLDVPKAVTDSFNQDGE